MSTGSVPTQMEESSVSKHEEGKEDAKMKKVVQAQEVTEELEECKTPTWSGNKIPLIHNCPPAPGKKRRPMPPFPSRMKRSSTTGFNYVVKPDEVESFFQSMFELTRVNKSRRSMNYFSG
ncbi:cyclin-dependent protein kinase inhibitor SMR1-like [Abrus precatorius]|uniref:Cyclin-dependent protein kinase inhibitor SMR1-like n=1 Tax=Abrus precatorius TaxID=3816 RepID=A0A8B8L0S6_ABRPR|nr:cyclin-dependent protein kinase inhibitor SMR1-like [Abrus precatorius]